MPDAPFHWEERMTQRLRARQAIVVGGKQINVGDVFPAKPADANQLIAAGQAEEVDKEGRTSEERKTARRAEKNATRAKR